MPLLETLAHILEYSAAVAPMIPNPGPIRPPGLGGFDTIISWAKWIGYALAGVALIIVAIRMFFNARRGEGGEHLGALGWILGGVILIGGGVGLVTTLMGG